MQYDWVDDEGVTEPLTLARAKEHLNVLHDKHDDLITDYIKAARHWTEGYISRALVAKTVTVLLSIDELRKVDDVYQVRLPIASTVTAINTITIDGATFDKSKTNLYGPRLPLLEIDATALEDVDTPRNIVIEYDATVYANQYNCKMAMLQIVGNFFHHRDSTPLEEQSHIASILTPDKLHYYV